MLKSLPIQRGQLSKQGERSAAIPTTGVAPTRAIHHGIMPGSAKGVEWKGLQMLEDAGFRKLNPACGTPANRRGK